MSVQQLRKKYCKNTNFSTLTNIGHKNVFGGGGNFSWSGQFQKRGIGWKKLPKNDKLNFWAFFLKNELWFFALQIGSSPSIFFRWRFVHFLEIQWKNKKWSRQPSKRNSEWKNLITFGITQYHFFREDPIFLRKNLTTSWAHNKFIWENSPKNLLWKSWRFFFKPDSEMLKFNPIEKNRLPPKKLNN